MKHQQDHDTVRDHLLQQQLEELGGSTQAPDRRELILARAAAGPAQRTGAPLPWLVAAALLIGVATTVAVATSSRRSQVQAEPPIEAPWTSNGQVVTQHESAQLGSITEPPVPQVTGNRHQPAGTDPADLKVLRSAEAMLDAEQKLKQKLAEGKIAGVDALLPFETLSTDWTYRRGLEGAPRPILELDGDRVVMIGFMLPIDEVEGMREFLLVQSLWSCCYGTPPDIHQIVRCVLPADKRVDYGFEPVMLVGEFRVEVTTTEGYVVDIFQLHVDFLEVLD